MIFPNQYPAWRGWDDADTGATTIENFNRFSGADLSFHFRPLGLHFAHADGFHDFDHATNAKSVKPMFFKV